MKRLFYFLKIYYIELLTAFGGLISAIGSFYFFDDPIKLLVCSISIVTVSLIIIIFARLRERSFVFSPLTWRSDKKSWIGYGEFDISEAQKSFIITNADPGYIHNECLTWTDYTLSFDFKIGKTCLGVIVRAVNLANYVMLQITQSGIRPHIRINGGWKCWEANEVSLQTEISLDKWYKATISCEKNKVFIKLYYGEKSILDRVWSIPLGNFVFNFKKDGNDNGINIPFPINLEYGSSGFRNWGDESALIRNVLIQKQ